jgi:hypothetical protein
MATPHYVPPSPWSSRVTLTAEMPKVGYGSTVYFLGEFEGSPVKVEVFSVDILHIRRALAEHGAVTFDTPTYRIDPATAADAQAAARLAAKSAEDGPPIPLDHEERVGLAALKLLQRAGIVGPERGS